MRRYPCGASCQARLFGFCLRRGYGEAIRILAGALAVGLFGLAAPLITEALINSVIPRAEFGQLGYCAAALTMVAIGVGEFQAVQNIATLRLQGVLNRTLQAGGSSTGCCDCQFHSSNDIQWEIAVTACWVWTRSGGSSPGARSRIAGGRIHDGQLWIDVLSGCRP